MEKDEKYILKFDGSFPENKNIKLSLSPEIAFRIDLLAKKSEVSFEKYIENVLREHTEKFFTNKKDFYKKFFE